MSRRILYASGIVIVMGCSGDGGGGPGANGRVQLDNRAAVHDSITVTGGTLTTVSHGVSYTLTIPAGALETPQRITMTPVTDIDGLGVTQFVGAVDLEPQGLVLGRVATLKITVPHSPPAGTALMGFGFEGDADALSVLLPVDSAGAIRIAIRHFSGGGAAFATLGEIQGFAPRGPNTENVPYLVDLMALQFASPRDFAGEITLMRAWFDSVVSPKIESAASDVALLRAMSEYDFWRSTQTPANLIPDDPLFLPERARFATAALPRLVAALADNNDRCQQDHDITFANNVLFWQTTAHDLGLDTAGSGLDRASVLAGLCVQVALLRVDYPNPPVVGQPHSLDLEAELRFPSDGFLLIQPFSFEVSLTGAQQAGPITGFSDNLGNFTAVVTPAQSVLTIDIKACLFSALVPYADVCTTGGLVRGATDLTGTWTGRLRLADALAISQLPIEFQITQIQNAITGTFTVPATGAPFGSISATLSNDTLFNFTLDEGGPCGTRVINGLGRVVNGEIRVPALTGPACAGSTLADLVVTRASGTPVDGLYTGSVHSSTNPALEQVGATLVIQFGDTLFFESPDNFFPNVQVPIAGVGAVLSGTTLTESGPATLSCLLLLGAFGPRSSCAIPPNGSETLTGTLSGGTLSASVNFVNVGTSEIFLLQRQ
jgi:hypothetical protein